MRTEKVISNYVQLSDDELSVFGGKVATAMTDNPNFTDPIPTLVELQAAVEDYRQKQETATRGGSVLDGRLKTASRKLLLKLLSHLAHYVNRIADGDLPILTSSALILAKQPGEIGQPTLVTHVVLGDGPLSGQMRVDFASQKQVWDYEIQVGETAPDSQGIVWGQSHMTTKSQGNIIAPVVPAKTYHVRVRARNGKGNGDWSAPVSLIAR